MTYNALNQYRQNTVFTATPEELTLMLYDGAIKFMNIAKYNIENSQIEKAHQALIRAQDIILELSSSLNMEYEISNNFKQLYDFIMNNLIDANINKEIKPIDEALEILTEMRDIWKEVMKEVKKKVYQNRQV
ncbi:Flagellar protein FliS [[Clostridium] ultunense Esp]|uniref:Flagellar secretion chaperone FliS n=1 Tax=[Clostridium] ultunense Esp TaxID=1288971 RepID=M1ZAA7_9FIRM|nr:flagellar export chaperone FliS [Schnuerera ultunensis]CCQ94613.1 Flagellar protein FliS [[Clostridium] ultunense Esp]SHD76717.1 flagellar assembly protein FliS [[Clostridium] ultunense Esp]